MLGFVLVLLLQRLRALGSSQSRTGNLVLPWMHEHLGIFPCSHPLCNEIAPSRTGDNEHCIADYHGPEADLPCAEGNAVNQDMIRGTVNKREMLILYFLYHMPLRINVFRNLIDMVKMRFVFF